MTNLAAVAAVVSLTLAAAPAAPAQDMKEHESHGSAIAASPQWDKVKSLVGEWEGYVMQGDAKVPTKVWVRLTGDGSAVMHWLDRDTPHEMVTMFHMDKASLMATHYCAAHNQPRFIATPGGDPSRIVFDFKDGTNIHPGDGYMKRLALVFIDADHHDEEWSYDQGGTLHTGTFHFTRKK
jgi:hypothetical protein